MIRPVIMSLGRNNTASSNVKEDAIFFLYSLPEEVRDPDNIVIKPNNVIFQWKDNSVKFTGSGCYHFKGKNQEKDIYYSSSVSYTLDANVKVCLQQV